jgi:hypothetical protein
MKKLAQQAGKSIMVGSQASSGLGTVQSAILASHKDTTHPCELSFPLKLYKDSIETGLVYQKGYLLSNQLVDMKCTV